MIRSPVCEKTHINRLLKNSLCWRLNQAVSKIKRDKRLIFRAHLCGPVPQRWLEKVSKRLFQHPEKDDAGQSGAGAVSQHLPDRPSSAEPPCHATFTRANAARPGALPPPKHTAQKAPRAPDLTLFHASPDRAPSRKKIAKPQPTGPAAQYGCVNVPTHTPSNERKLP
ncbi:hypothetical protein [Isoalcanivorax pacificus]|uniref:hypothetical protein n=1 Tax=Isoalcanivorax pacificus TaxID=1306787 RepID=UPI001185D392|nr:hypothetical protein [Isoalcanivorax pacificus]